MKFKQFLGVSLCAVVLSLGFASCDSDDDSDLENQQVSLLGTWRIKEVKAKVEVTNPDIEEAVIEAVKTLSTATDDTYVFYQDGSYKAKVSAEDEGVEGTYKVDGDKLTLGNEEESVTFSFTGATFENSQDVKATVAEQLGIDESEITTAIQLNVFDCVTK